jgi:hypothetical protein
MERRNLLLSALLFVIAACLVKLAFVGPEPRMEIIPQAQAQTGIVEWNNSLKMVTTGDNGATTYVWDYQGKTALRKYYVDNGKLKMKSFELVEE